MKNTHNLKLTRRKPIEHHMLPDSEAAKIPAQLCTGSARIRLRREHPEAVAKLLQVVIRLAPAPGTQAIAIDISQIILCSGRNNQHP